MRKVIFGGANSLDNFIARPDGGLDWLLWSDEVTELMKDYWARFDTIVMGRKTYDVAVEQSPNTQDGRSADPYGDLRTIVFSRKLEPGTRDGVEIISGDAGEFVRDLKNEQEGKDICVMGGGELARDLFEAGVIDEVGLNIHPVLLGSGIPLFHEIPHQLDLELLECKPMKNGCIYVSYRVLNQ